MSEPFKPGYHLVPIAKGVLGETSKIAEELEELEELEDAQRQGNRIMMLVELSDLYGAVEHYLETKFPGMAMADLAVMAATTRRAFDNGRR